MISNAYHHRNDCQELQQAIAIIVEQSSNQNLLINPTINGISAKATSNVVIRKRTLIERTNLKCRPDFREAFVQTPIHTDTNTYLMYEILSKHFVPVMS